VLVHLLEDIRCGEPAPGQTLLDTRVVHLVIDGVVAVVGLPGLLQAVLVFESHAPPTAFPRGLIVEDEIFFALEQVELDQTNRKRAPVD
jgi:hypothetical protein